MSSLRSTKSKLTLITSVGQVAAFRSAAPPKKKHRLHTTRQLEALARDMIDETAHTRSRHLTKSPPVTIIN